MATVKESIGSPSAEPSTSKVNHIGKRGMTQQFGLRDRLIGSWMLKSYVETDVKTGARHHPLGQSPLGIILYTPDGYMSVQLQARDRDPFLTDDMYRGTAAEYFAAGRSYLAYSGRFFIDEGKGRLSHEMAVSLFPNWFGQTQIRLVELRDNRLHLATDGPQRFNGALKTADLVWMRAVSNP
ncbi:lipocalin-like domain-containing protein [Neoasaia chiangmaiensis]|nr:lipocalin-like domain-containing protein [Neoasaia chiangmaiensis]